MDSYFKFKILISFTGAKSILSYHLMCSMYGMENIIGLYPG